MQHLWCGSRVTVRCTEFACTSLIALQEFHPADSSVLPLQLKFKGGTIRVNVFPDDTRVLPKLDVELFYFFGQINMYINLAARSNLVRHPPHQS